MGWRRLFPALDLFVLYLLKEKYGKHREETEVCCSRAGFEEKCGSKTLPVRP